MIEVRGNIKERILNPLNQMYAFIEFHILISPVYFIVHD